MADVDTPHPLRPILKNWIWEHGQIGTRYLDCADGAVKFDDGRKSRFANEKIFHVSLKKDADEAAHTAGLVIHEGALARFLHAAQIGKPEEAGSVADVQRAVQDCVDIGLLCTYQRDASEAIARYAQEAMFDDEIRAAVIADIRTKYVTWRAQLTMYDFVVFYGVPAPLQINESPFIDWRRVKPPQPFVSLPLGPSCMLVGSPSAKTSRAAPVLWKTAVRMGPLIDHNRHIVEGARSWLVATADDQLVAVQAKFTPGPAAA
jgi:hypothetical protein